MTKNKVVIEAIIIQGRVENIDDNDIDDDDKIKGFFRKGTMREQLAIKKIDFEEDDFKIEASDIIGVDVRMVFCKK